MKRTLSFLRLIDEHDGNISLTNVALLIVLVKLAITQNVSLIDAGSLLVTLLSYQAKKIINKDAGTAEALRDELTATSTVTAQTAQSVDSIIKRVEDLASKVSASQIAMGMKERK